MIEIEGGTTVQAMEERVPGDPSAAAFWLVAGLIHPDAELLIRNVGVNPTRRAVIDLLPGWAGGSRNAPSAEPCRGDRDPGGRGAGRRPGRAELRARAIDIAPAEVAAAIDEIPILCLAATAGPGPDDDPRGGRAAPQGVRPAGRHRGRSRRPGCPNRGGRRRPHDRRARPPGRRAPRTAWTTTGSP